MSVNLLPSEWSGTLISGFKALTAGVDDGNVSPIGFSNWFHCMTVLAIAT
jgi:diketogulonate reductase-like aldo/keto reductase